MRNINTPYHPRVLLVTGSGRNVGKTTFSTGLIKKFSTQFNIVGIKISPHFHAVDYQRSIVEFAGRYAVYKEEDANKSKDSSRMKAAGAETAFYVQAKEEYLYQAFLELLSNLKGNSMIVCESGGLHQHINAGLLFYLSSDEVNSKPPPPKSIPLLKGDDFFIESINQVQIKNNSWSYLNEYEVI